MSPFLKKRTKFIIYKKTTSKLVMVRKLLYLGGGEESRTPVHNTFHINFSECSLLFLFIYITQTNMLNINIAFKYPLFSKQK